jgi:hypothetical protein
MSEPLKVEAGEVVEEQKTIIIPTRKVYPHQRIDPKDPLVLNDKVEFVYRKNGIEEIISTYVQDTPVALGKEIRVDYSWRINEDIAFTSPMSEHRVVNFSGVAVDAKVIK